MTVEGAKLNDELQWRFLIFAMSEALVELKSTVAVCIKVRVTTAINQRVCCRIKDRIVHKARSMLTATHHKSHIGH